MSKTTVVAVGLTGNGKSALCNRFHGSSVFSESDGADGETMSTEVQNGTFCIGEQCKLSVRVVDTPGLGDRDDRDSDHIKQMIDVIRGLKAVHVFCIVINFQSPRIDSNTKRLIQLLPAMLPGKNFWKNVVVVFTKVYRPMTKKAEIDQRLKQFQKRFSDEFHADLEAVQFAFIDSREEKEECEENVSQLRNIFEYIRNAMPFPTTDAKAVEGGLEFEAVKKQKALEGQVKSEQEQRATDQRQHNEVMRQMEARQRDSEALHQRELGAAKEATLKAQAEANKEAEKRKEAEKEARDLETRMANLRLEQQRSPPMPQVIIVPSPSDGAGFGGFGGGMMPPMMPSSMMGDYGGHLGGHRAIAAPSEHVLSNGGTFYRGVGRPRNSDYTAGGNLRRHH